MLPASAGDETPADGGPTDGRELSAQPTPPPRSATPPAAAPISRPRRLGGRATPPGSTSGPGGSTSRPDRGPPGPGSHGPPGPGGAVVPGAAPGEGLVAGPRDQPPGTWVAGASWSAPICAVSAACCAWMTPATSGGQNAAGDSPWRSAADVL